MPAAAFLARERVAAHQFTEFQEVGHAAGLLEGLVDRVGRTGHANIGPELFPQGRNELQRLRQSFTGPRHTAELPHDLAESLVKMADGFLALVFEKPPGH